MYNQNEGKNSKTITKGLSSHEGSTSFESAAEISSCLATTPGLASSGNSRGRSIEALDLPSPPLEIRQSELDSQRESAVEVPLSSEGEDDSTKKDDEQAEGDEAEEVADNDDQSSEGEYSLGTAEGIEGASDRISSRNKPLYSQTFTLMNRWNVAIIEYFRGL